MMSSDPNDETRLTEFVYNLDRLGSNPDLWPQPDAEAARRLLADSIAAQQALAAARTLDAGLQHLPHISAPPGLLARVSRRPEPDLWETLTLWFTTALWRPLLAGTVPLIAGFILGFTLAPDTNDTMADQMSLVTVSTSIDAAGNEEFDYDL
jgi:hypothetical protein